MPDLEDGASTQVKGSGSSSYTLKNSGGVYSCTCPAWRNQSEPIERRTCKHLRRLRGDEAERTRIGAAELSNPMASTPAASSTGEASSEPPVLLAHRWEPEVDLTDWWLSEKLDGVRAYWDGKQFLSRLGNRLHAPAWFTEGFPDHPLDGELWGGRKQFQRTVGIVKRQDQSPLWRDLLYVVFDLPAHDAPFEERVERCNTLLAQGDLPYARAHAHERCQGLEHLRAALQRVEALGGEGLMARKPGSLYEVGRSFTLLKVKTFRDAEARVIGHTHGAGKHKGRVGALIVELPDGTRFNVGTGLSDEERKNPPPVGSLITFRYQELSDGGVPRFPSYVGVRIDGRWEGSAALPVVMSVAAPSTAATPAEKSAAPPAAKPEPKPATGASAKSGDAAARYFEFVDGKSSKFWEVQLDGSSLITRYGRIGTDGQRTLKDFTSEDGARREREKLVLEKTKKGYVEK
jgi:DNA ligase-1